MSSDLSTQKLVIDVHGASKQYPTRINPWKRMWQALSGAVSTVADGPVYTALEPCHLKIHQGEVVGVVGKNGAGKSTLLQLVSSTVQPSSGSIFVNGKISAILELGAGFNTEFSGRENIFLATATAGIAHDKAMSLINEIIDFSGIEAFIDQPIKTYSSGMVVRLAFAIATSTEPDLLIIDEALSVGDGEFARKSFDRILKLKNQGTTILFCTHSLFHIEAMCTRAIWLDKGQLLKDGHPSLVIPAYQDFLDGVPANEIRDANGSEPLTTLADVTNLVVPELTPPLKDVVSPHPLPPVGIRGYARMRHLSLGVVRDGVPETNFRVGSVAAVFGMVDSLVIRAEFDSDPALPAPSFAITVHSLDGRVLASAGAWNDGFRLQRSNNGSGAIELVFPKVALLKGTYSLSAYLFCERGLHIYDNADHFVRLQVSQNGLEQGVFHLPRIWKCTEPSVKSAFAQEGSERS